MAFTVAGLAELHRTILLCMYDNEQIIQTTKLKIPLKIAELKICMTLDERICQLRQFKSWFADREPVIPNNPQEHWSINYVQIYFQAGNIFKAVRTVKETHHPDIASTVRQSYDKNNNKEGKVALSRTEEEHDNDEDEEQERTLLEEIELNRFNIEQRIYDPVGVLSPCLSHLEFQKPYNGTNVTQPLPSFETEH
ncbi:MAG: hypothetical protein EZS28_041941, partial [Streblomastix strix]